MVFLIGIFFILTVVALVVGLVAFSLGGDFNKKYGNRMMKFRILFQAVAVVLGLTLVAMTAKS